MSRPGEVRTLFADVAIIGGGATGLAAAHRLVELAREQRRPCDVIVLEAAPRIGGSIRTERCGPALIDAGPDQFVTFKPAALELCHRLGLAAELVQLEGSRSMQVVHRGRPVPLPAGLELVPRRIGPLLASRLFTWRAKARLILERFRHHEGSSADESVASFTERRFGRELHERVVEPIVGGIYTADTRSLSSEMALPRLRAGGSADRTDPRRAGFAALRGGMARLVEQLASRLPADSVQCGARVSRIRPRRPGAAGWILELAGRRELHASAVVLAAPAPACAALLAPVDGDLGRRLASIAHASCATVSLLYPRAAVGRRLAGSGFFVPATASSALLACSYVSRKFPERAPADRLLFRVFLGGARQPHTLELDDARLARLAHRSLAALLDLHGEPELSHVSRFPQSMPQYPVGFRRVAREIADALEHQPGLLLCGSAVGAFGLPDCIASGERAAATAWSFAGLCHDRGRGPARAAR